MSRLANDFVDNFKEQPASSLYRAIVVGLLGVISWFFVGMHGDFKTAIDRIQLLQIETRVLNTDFYNLKDHVDYVDKRVRFLERNPWQPLIKPGPETYQGEN